MAAYLNFLTAYNNGGATPNMPDARKPLIFKAFRASLTLVPARYVAARDPKLFCDLALRAGHFPAEAIARGDDLFLPLRQAFVYKFSRNRQT